MTTSIEVVTQNSRRVFLALAGALMLGAIVQRTELLSKKEASPSPKPKSPSPTPTEPKAISSPTPTSSKQTASSTPTKSPTEAATPQPTQTAVLEGVVMQEHHVF